MLMVLGGVCFCQQIFAQIAGSNAVAMNKVSSGKGACCSGERAGLKSTRKQALYREIVTDNWRWSGRWEPSVYVAYAGQGTAYRNF